MPGAPPSETNVWIAAGEGKLDVVEGYLKNGTDPNAHDEFGYTALHAAASYNHTSMIDLLVKYGGNPNIPDFEGDTPLHVTETLEMAKHLVSLGADPKIRNKEGKLPIENADEEEWVEVVEYLKEFTPDYTPASHSDDDEDGNDLEHL
ncbi:hypothetical protein HDV05_000845, partial [Chytridiales sp. JEL 0842]